MRHLDDVHVVAAGETGIFIRKDVQNTTTGAHFFDVRFQFFQQFVVRCHHDNWHIRIDQRQRAMLQLACRIGFSVNIRDLFELQCAFQRNRILIATPQEQGVMFVREIFSQRLNAFVLRQHLLNTARQRLKAMHDVVFNGSILAFQTRQFRHQHQQNGQLSSKRFGGSHADFGTRFGHQRQIGFTYQRRARHVTNGQRAEVTQFFRQTQRRQGIGRFARLRKGDHQAVTTHRRFAIAELRGDFHITRHTRQGFKPVARDHTGVVRGTAGHDLNVLDFAQQFVGIGAQLAQIHFTMADATSQGVFNGVWLFVDLFLHVVTVSTFVARVVLQV